MSRADQLRAAFADLAAGNAPKSEHAFQALLDQDSALIEARYGLIGAKIAQSTWTAADGTAAAVLEQLIAKDKLDFPLVLTDAAREYYRAQRLDLAAAALRSAVRQMGRHANLLVLLARCELALGDNAAAEHLAREAAGMNGSLDASFLIGRAMERQGGLAEAEARYRAVMQERPSYPRVASYLANLLYKREDVDEALALALSAVKAMPSDAMAQFVAARCHARRNDLDAAEDALIALTRTHDLMTCQTAHISGLKYWREDAIEQLDIARAYWPLYSSVVARQGWLERALAESTVSDDPALEVRQPEKRVARPRGVHQGPHVTLVTFGSPAFRPLQERLTESAFALQEIDEVVLWNLSDLQATQFYRNHRTLLDRPRGAGFWAWKPYAILRALLDGAEGDYVIYYNCGRGDGNRITTSIRPLLDWCARHPAGMLPGVRRPVHGPSRYWTKRDCFHFMGCDSSEYWEHPQVGIQVSVWKNSADVRAFVRTWMTYCLDPRIISDHANVCGLPNHDGFLDHRQDQSVLTNLVARYGIEVPTINSADINEIASALKAAKR